MFAIIDATTGKGSGTFKFSIQNIIQYIKIQDLYQGMIRNLQKILSDLFIVNSSKTI
jgi:hypothetical protein